MREETQAQSTCAFCKQPITKHERPAVRMENGDEVHVRCWNDYNLSCEQKPN
jgi:hypothetical protein